MDCERICTDAGFDLENLFRGIPGFIAVSFCEIVGDAHDAKTLLSNHRGDNFF